MRDILRNGDGDREGIMGGVYWAENGVVVEGSGLGNEKDFIRI